MWSVVIDTNKYYVFKEAHAKYENYLIKNFNRYRNRKKFKCKVFLFK